MSRIHAGGANTYTLWLILTQTQSGTNKAQLKVEFLVAVSSSYLRVGHPLYIS